MPSEPAAVLILVLGSLQLNLSDHKFGLVINWISVGRARVAGSHHTRQSLPRATFPLFSNFYAVTLTYSFSCDPNHKILLL